MRNLSNSVQLVGRLGQQPEIKTVGDNKKLLRMSLAVNEYYQKEGEEKTQNTEWFNLVAWNRTAENMAKILMKGQQVAIQGKLTQNTYKDNVGVQRNSIQILVQDFLAVSNHK